MEDEEKRLAEARGNLETAIAYCAARGFVNHETIDEHEAAARAAERAKIVAWMRRAEMLAALATAIEKGDYER